MKSPAIFATVCGCRRLSLPSGWCVSSGRRSCACWRMWCCWCCGDVGASRRWRCACVGDVDVAASESPLRLLLLLLKEESVVAFAVVDVTTCKVDGEEEAGSAEDAVKCRGVVATESEGSETAAAAPAAAAAASPSAADAEAAAAAAAAAAACRLLRSSRSKRAVVEPEPYLLFSWSSVRVCLSCCSRSHCWCRCWWCR